MFKKIILFSKAEIQKVERQFQKKIFHIPESISSINKIFLSTQQKIKRYYLLEI